MWNSDGSGLQSYIRKGFLIYEEMRKYLVRYEEAVSHILYDFATAPFWISLYMTANRSHLNFTYMRKIFIFFISVPVPTWCLQYYPTCNFLQRLPDTDHLGDYPSPSNDSMLYVPSVKKASHL
jgi:hypothetical protein